MSTFVRMLRRLTLVGAAAVAVVAATGLAWEAYAEYTEAQQYRPPGRLIDAGGHRVHLLCNGRGGPAVVFESGVGDSSSVWERVKPEVARTTRACVYDRAGLGFSESGPDPRDSRQIVDELHAVLEGASEKGPFILVGHSIGALHARVYAGRFPNEVAGLVLVDPTPEQLVVNPPAAAAPIVDATNRVAPLVAIFRTGAAYLGFSRLACVWGGEGTRTIARERATLRRETLAIADDARQAAESNVASEVRVVILSSVKAGPVSNEPPFASLFLPRGYDVAQGLRTLSDAKTAAHEQFVRGRGRGKLIRTDRSDHYIQSQEPQLVIDAIREMVNSFR